MANKYDYRQLREIINANHDRFSSLNFDNSMSLLQKMEALAEWFKVIGKEFNDVVNYLDEFQAKFDENLYNTVDDILDVWYDSGKFEDLFKSKIFADFIAQLNQKRDKSVKITSGDLDTSSDEAKIGLPNLKQSVIDAMTGNTSVSPTIPDRSINKIKLARKTLSQEEIGFLVNNFNLNLFDGVYRMGSVRAGSQGFYLEGTTNPNYKLAVVTVEGNQTYYIKRSLPSRLNIATATKSIGEGETFDGGVGLNYSLSGTSYYPQYVKVTTGVNDKYMYLSMSVDNTEPYLCVSKTPPKNNVNYYYNQPNATVDIHSETNLTEPYNIFGGEYEWNRAIEGSEPYNIINRTGSRMAIIPITPNTDYTLIRQTPSRLNWGTATDLLDTNSPLDGSIKRNDSGAGTSTSPEIINFRSGANDRWLYVNISVDNTEPTLRVIEGTVLDKTQQLNYFDKKLANSYKRWLQDYVKMNSMVTTPSRKTRVKYTAPDLIEIYQPTTNDKYIKFDYRLINNTSINMNQWRVLKTYVTDNKFIVLHDLDTQTEWEGAIKEVGADDFMGGTHGDERNTSLTILLDGKATTLQNSFDVEVENIKIINHSILNRVGSEVDLLKRIKVNEWDIDKYSVTNKYTCLQDFEIDQSKIGLMSCRYSDNGNLINKGYRDNDYNVQAMSATSIGDLGTKYKDVRALTMFGDNIYLSLLCEADYNKYPNTNQYIENFNNETIPRAKAYFDITGRYSIKQGELLENKSIFTIMG